MGQRRCRRFATALAMLESPELCTFDRTAGNRSDPAAPYIMLETFRQLSIQTSLTLAAIFDALSAYLDAPRSKKAVRSEMSTIGSGLGLCHDAMSRFGKGLIARVHCVSRVYRFVDRANPFSGRCWRISIG